VKRLPGDLAALRGETDEHPAPVGRIRHAADEPGSFEPVQPRGHRPRGDQGFPDLRITVDKVVSDGDCVVGYGLISGTNTGSFFGMPPSGKSAEFGYIDVYRIDEGRGSEAWHIEDIAGLMRQLRSATPESVTT